MATKAMLLVDDEAILLLSLKQSLRLHFGPSFIYETALNGEDGLERIRSLFQEGIEIVLVISDWLMPGMKGDEFLSRIHELYPLIKLIMLTGHMDESEMEKLANEVALAACLRKPWNSAQLFDVVSSALC